MPPSNRTDISGAFQRPILVDYLIVAEHERVDVSLHLYIGVLEVGKLGVSGGQVVHAELPGASGDAALSLLARMPGARIMPETWSHCVTNVTKPWRELVDASAEDGSAPGRSQRLAEVRAELRELASEVASASKPEPESDDRIELHVVAECLDWVAIEHYLDNDLERARALVLRSEQLRPGDLLRAANLERLRLRLLEDEITSGVAEVTE